MVRIEKENETHILAELSAYRSHCFLQSGGVHHHLREKKTRGRDDRNRKRGQVGENNISMKLQQFVGKDIGG